MEEDAVSDPNPAVPAGEVGVETHATTEEASVLMTRVSRNSTRPAAMSPDRLSALPSENFSAMNAETDTTDLVGGYEQADPLRKTANLLRQFSTTVDGLAKRALAEGSQEHYVRMASDLRRIQDHGSRSPLLR